MGFFPDLELFAPVESHQLSGPIDGAVELGGESRETVGRRAITTKAARDEAQQKGSYGPLPLGVLV